MLTRIIQVDKEYAVIIPDEIVKKLDYMLMKRLTLNTMKLVGK